MRSLVLLSIAKADVPLSSPNARIAATTVDSSSSKVFTITEDATADGVCHFSVYVAEDSDLESAHLLCEWTTGDPCPPSDTQVIAFQHMQETDSLVVVCANGDIEQIMELDSQEAIRDNVGSVESGIHAAQVSPDQELISIVSGDGKFILMTKDFQVLSEGLIKTASFGEDAPVNVGWGQKSTQFHGSVGKTAAAAKSSVIMPAPDDDGRPALSWRGDSAYFAISTFEIPPVASTSSAPAEPRRIIRVYNRLAGHSSTSEAVSEQEGTLAWQPSGSIIASTQKRGDQAHVIFFERNGLRRYDFQLRSKGHVRSLAWNSDGTLLAVHTVLDDSREHEVQVWYRNNYHWYLKQTLKPSALSKEPVTSIAWHPEDPLRIDVCTQTSLQSFQMEWEVFRSCRPSPRDDGTVIVVDGRDLLFTPFRYENIPPPMAAQTLQSNIESTPTYVAFDDSESALVVGPGSCELWSWTRPSKKRDALSSMVRSRSTTFDDYAIQAAALKDGWAILSRSKTGLTVWFLDTGLRQQDTTTVPGTARKLMGAGDSALLELSDGQLLKVVPGNDVPEPVSSGFPTFCSTVAYISEGLVVGQTSTGGLYCTDFRIADDSTTFAFTPHYLLYTTFSHEVKFVPLEALRRHELVNVGSGLKRAVERGSRIVTVVPSSTALVLQMPRGNLETVCPRPLVLDVVRDHLSSGRYRAAFMECRKHRIDLNILYDHDPPRFEANLAAFVDQIKDVDYLNLFLSGLKDEDVNVTMYRLENPASLGSTVDKKGERPGKTSKVCDLVRGELEKRDVWQYVNSILTAHVRKKPPAYEDALRVLADLRERDAEQAEEAVKYIIFLSDANKLFNLALGMYDFSLVLLVAQNSQKDPREYLPFLRELRALETYYQRFRIDDHLERHESALKNLAKAGEDKFDEAIEYMKKHSLYDTAAQIYTSEPAKHRVVLFEQAQDLLDRRSYAEAGLLFHLAQKYDEAIHAYAKANAWQELFTIVLHESRRPASEIKALAEDVADRLKSKRMYADAGKVLLDYARDVEQSVEAYVEGNLFVEAVRLSMLYNRKELIETLIKPATLETANRLTEDCVEVEDQARKQIERLGELQIRKQQNPYSFYGVEDPNLAFEGGEILPDGMSDAGTAFTRYTRFATTLNSQSTKKSFKTAKSRRKASVKKAGGRKGSVYEETYLMNSIKKTVEVRLAELQTEVKALLPVLLTLHSSTHRKAARDVQAQLRALEQTLKQLVLDFWIEREAEWRKELEEEEAIRDAGLPFDKPPLPEGAERVQRPALSKIGLELII